MPQRQGFFRALSAEFRHLPAHPGDQQQRQPGHDGEAQAPAQQVAEQRARRDAERHRQRRADHGDGAPLQVRREADEPDVVLPARLVSTSIEALDYAVRQGLGIACPISSVGEAVARGELQRVLDAHLEHSSTFWVLWPSSRHAAAKLRVFIDHLCASLLPDARGR